MAILNKKPRLIRAALHFIEDRLATGSVSFSLTYLTGETGLSATAALSQLRRLGDRVIRVSQPQQFFLIVGPEHRSAGAPPANWWLDDYFQWLGHHYYVGLQSAAGVYGASPQGLQVTQVITDAPRRELQVGQLRVRFFVKRRIEHTPTQPLQNNYAPLRVSIPEATAFDLIRYAARIGGLERVVETLVSLLPLCRITGLRQVLDAENELATAQRLGHILERSGQLRLAQVVHDWLPSELPLIPLDLAAPEPSHGRVVPRWRIIENLKTAA